METTYTQVMDKDGTIKYVPNNPPPQEAKMGGDKPSTEPYEKEVREHLGDEFDLDVDSKLTGELANLLANSKRLRYDKRLDTGKLDGSRLSAYRTSNRLFKKKAIKDRNYQFTFLIDTSGSMLDQENDDDNTKLRMAIEAVAKTVKSLENIKTRSSIFSMNNAFELVKSFEETLDDTRFVNDIVRTVSGKFTNEDGQSINKAGGTFEWVAYEQTMKYLANNTPAKATNVVIVLSDGKPSGSGSQCEVTIGGVTELVDSQGDKDRVETLAKFWDKQYPTLAFGIGIQSKARQVPVNKRIDDIEKLPEVLSNLLTELML